MAFDATLGAGVATGEDVALFLLFVLFVVFVVFVLMRREPFRWCARGI